MTQPNQTYTNYVGVLPYAWSGQNAEGLYCCPECWGYRKTTMVTPERFRDLNTGWWLNQKWVECPICQGVGGVAERRKGDRRK